MSLKINNATKLYDISIVVLAISLIPLSDKKINKWYHSSLIRKMTSWNWWYHKIIKFFFSKMASYTCYMLYVFLYSIFHAQKSVPSQKCIWVVYKW